MPHFPHDAPRDATRTERDSLGERDIPAHARWGISTFRAVENFPVSGRPIGGFRSLIWALGAIKCAAARTNQQLGRLEDWRYDAIEKATQSVMEGRHDDEFVVDRIQGGAGTSTNMNANEVIANLALEELGKEPGDYQAINPIDHVNCSQSTNDVYPTAAKIAIQRSLAGLIDEHTALAASFRAKATEFADIIKVGRTQLQDAVPMTLGQEFGAFAQTLEEDVARLQELPVHLAEINLGATAIGTGIHRTARIPRSRGARTGPDHRPRAGQRHGLGGGYIGYRGVHPGLRNPEACRRQAVENLQ